MTTTSDRLRAHFHRDPWYGHNDWDAVFAFICALMEDSEVPWCFPFAGELIMGTYTPMTQSLIQYLGFMRDERGIDILRNRLESFSPGDRTLQTPWCTAGRPAEEICLEALAKIGGPGVRDIFDTLVADPDHAHLHDTIRSLAIADLPRPAAAPMPADFPEILKGIHSANGFMREDDEVVDGGDDCAQGEEAEESRRKKLVEQEQERRANRQQILAAWRGLPFPGHVEMLSGDGGTRTFELQTPFAGRIHNVADPFSDFGVFLSDPKVEYPTGVRRWAHSHTFLCYQVPDGSMWNREYTWDEQANTITTHFRQRIDAEPVTVNPDGRSVNVAGAPIATAIVTRGNLATGRCNSAVLGAWENPEQEGRNYYTRRGNVLLPYKKLCYVALLHQPLVQVLGLWMADEQDHLERFFDAEGMCTDEAGVIEQLLIPLHEPGVLTLTTDTYQPIGPNDPYGRKTPERLWPELTPVPDPSHLDRVMGARFEKDCGGLAGWEQGTDNGYNPGYDINGDGVIDERDREILAQHTKRVYRYNMMQHNYFGLNWVGAGYGCRSRNFKNDPPLFVASYDYGAGYDSQTGRIELAEPAEPGSTLFVTYYREAPAAPGEDNIKVYLHRGQASKV